MVSHYQAVRTWLRTLPGPVFDDNPQRVLKRAWGLSGIQCSLGEFSDALWRHGFKPDQRGKKWVLALPSRPTGGANWDRIRRLNNIAG